MTSSALTDRLSQYTGGNVHVTRLVVVILGFIASAIVWLIADPIGGANLSATDWGGDAVSIGLAEVFFGFLSWGIGAWIVLMLIERFSPNARQHWLIISVAALLISFIFVFTGAENTATKTTFIIMHIASAAVLIPGLAATIRQR